MESYTVWHPMMFFVLPAVMLCSSYIFSKIRLLDILLPLFCCFLIAEIRTSSRTFLDVKTWVNNSICEAIDNDIVSQFVEADRNVEREIVLYVSKFEASTNDNFPPGTYGGNWISRTLYKHGVIDRPITVTEMIPTREKNEQFNLD